MARPSKYTKAIANKICQHIASGKSLRSYCKIKGNPSMSMVMRWLFDEDKTEFREQYAHAREAQAEVWADEIIDIADECEKDADPDGKINHENINRSRLRVDSRKWVASKLLSKKYGDKIAHQHGSETGGPVEFVMVVNEKSN